MAIFARLVCMIFAVGLGIGLGLIFGFQGGNHETALGTSAIGGVVGVFVGWLLGRMVAGKPPKE